jgi:hypothetical protein
MDLAQLEIAMQVAAAGEIARTWFLPTREADREQCAAVAGGRGCLGLKTSRRVSRMVLRWPIGTSAHDRQPSDISQQILTQRNIRVTPWLLCNAGWASGAERIGVVIPEREVGMAGRDAARRPRRILHEVLISFPNRHWMEER